MSQTTLTLTSAADRERAVAFIRALPDYAVLIIRPAKRAPLAHRLMSQVEFDTIGGCWLWSGHLTGHGYGSLTIDGRLTLAHRASYAHFVGGLPPYDAADRDPVVVMHSCDVRSCINPAHLSLGTQLRNIADRHAKGRNGNDFTRKGAAHPMARLSVESVRAIRRRHADGETYRELAEVFGLHADYVGLVVTGRRWGHVQ